MGGIGSKTRAVEVDPDRAQRFREVLAETISITEENGFPYLIAGSLASTTWGRPGSLGDIDLFVDPRHATVLLKALDEAGYDAQEAEPKWLFKAKKDGVTVDVIFEMAGPLYLEPQMIERAAVREVQGTPLRLMSPEDFVLSQALSLKEDTPDYWFNALGVIARQDLDWDYIIEMAPRGPRKLLSLLLLAQSEDLPVPDSVIRRLFTATFGG